MLLATEVVGHDVPSMDGIPNGPVAQSVRALACHARGRGFEPHPGRQKLFI